MFLNSTISCLILPRTVPQPFHQTSFYLTTNTSILEARTFSCLCLDLNEDQRTEVKVILQELCTGLVTATERQLADFLPEGCYHDVPEDDQLRGKMSHSHLTNLTGEQLFGDLDFSLFKRRSASLFYHSTINILKRGTVILKSLTCSGTSRTGRVDLGHIMLRSPFLFSQVSSHIQH